VGEPFPHPNSRVSKTMTKDWSDAHRHFSGALFNEAWTLIEKPDRDDQDDEQMVATAFASYFHWTQRPDVDDQKRSIGCWQISRVCALVGEASHAKRWAERSIRYAVNHGDDPFYVGYGYEALARAAKVAGEPAALRDALASARACAERVEDDTMRAPLEADLATIA